MAAEGPGDLPVPDLWTMQELCQPSLNGRGGPIAPIAIQATNLGLKNDMIQQVQNSCQFHGLPGDDANKHLDKFLHVTQSVKVNGVTDDAFRLHLFPHSLTHHATGGTFMKGRPKECYDLIKNMTAHHNDWDTSAQRSESSSSITSSDMEIIALKAEMAEINKNLMRFLQVNQQVKAVTLNCETCGGPHSLSDCPSTIGNTQNIPQPQVVTTNEFTNFMKENDAILKNMQTNMISLTNSKLELKVRSVHEDKYRFIFGFGNSLRSESSSYTTSSSDPEIVALKAEMVEINKNLMKVLQINQQVKAVAHNYETCGGPHSYNDCPATIGQTQNVYAVGAYNQGAYQAPAYQASGYQASVHQVSIPQPQVVTTTEFTNYMKMNTASSLGSGTFPINTITNPKKDLKGITTRSGNAYKGTTIPTTSPPPKVVERETEVTKDTVPPTNNGSTKDVQPPVV
nr:reverse transcriptase domain-containing protein [Tanacetum cinerariifolium]